MANIVADSGCNKGQLSLLVEAICRDFRRHDKGVTEQLVDWQRQSNTNGGKDSTARPNLALWFPPVDTTAAGFLLNSMALEPEGRTQYFNLPVHNSRFRCALSLRNHQENPQKLRHFLSEIT